MRCIIVGLGVQGQKRARIAGTDLVATVDPCNAAATFQSIDDVPLNTYDAALICTPDAPKADLLFRLLEVGKHVLVEKPLWMADAASFDALEALAQRTGALCATAYNHRFEPHFVRMGELIASGRLGRIYRCRLFYGNGTAALVKQSDWRDRGAGVLPDLGSHLLDTIAYWFGPLRDGFRLVSVDRHENLAPDHVVVVSSSSEPRIELEMTLLSWRNHFTCDIFAEKGSAHIESLCKWGPASFTVRERILPSGRPREESVILVDGDPTWEAEYIAFKNRVLRGNRTDLSHDRWIWETLDRLTPVAGEMST